MDGPRVKEDAFTERYGVIAVERAALDARCIWRETPERKHRAYWERHPLPVIVALHDEGRGLTIWCDARAQLRAGANTLRVPLANRFDAAGVLAALAIDGPLPEARRSPQSCSPRWRLRATRSRASMPGGA